MKATSIAKMRGLYFAELPKLPCDRHDWNEGHGLPRSTRDWSRADWKRAVAILLGFETIGLIGVDLTEDRYPNVDRPNHEWGRLAGIAEAMGSRIINLNPDSRLTSVASGGWGEIATK